MDPPKGQRKPKSAGGRRLLDPAKREQIALLCLDPTLGRNEIVRRTGVSVPTVRKIAEEVGRDFGSPHTAGVTPPPTAAQVQRKRTVRERRLLLAELLVEDAITERGLRTSLAAIRDRADLTRSIGGLVKALADLAAIEAMERAQEADRKAASDLDDWLVHMAGEATG